MPRLTSKTVEEVFLPLGMSYLVRAKVLRKPVKMVLFGDVGLELDNVRALLDLSIELLNLCERRCWRAENRSCQ